MFSDIFDPDARTRASLARSPFGLLFLAWLNDFEEEDGASL